MDVNERVLSRLKRITSVETSPRTTAKEPSDGHDNGRVDRRKPALLAGLIILPANNTIINCLVQDLSVSGAKLQLHIPENRPFEAPLKLPQEFRFAIPADGKEVDAALAWHKAATIGIRFISAFRMTRMQSLQPRM